MSNVRTRIVRRAIVAVLSVIMPIGAVSGLGYAAAPSPIGTAPPTAEPTPDYQQLLSAAAEVRNRHLAEWKKIPHVVDARAALSGGMVAIDIQVDSPDNVAEVERAFPPEVEDVYIIVVPGYRRLQVVAEEVRRRHLSEWMKIPHVVGASLGLSGSKIVIDVEVDNPDKVAEVERKVPHEVEGVGIVVVPVPNITAY